MRQSLKTRKARLSPLHSRLSSRTNRVSETDAKETTPAPVIDPLALPFEGSSDVDHVARARSLQTDGDALSARPSRELRVAVGRQRPYNS